jgi:hypothetical protein
MLGDVGRRDPQQEHGAYHRANNSGHFPQVFLQNRFALTRTTCTEMASAVVRALKTDRCGECAGLSPTAQVVIGLPAQVSLSAELVAPDVLLLALGAGPTDEPSQFTV